MSKNWEQQMSERGDADHGRMGEINRFLGSSGVRCVACFGGYKDEIVLWHGSSEIRILAYLFTNSDGLSCTVNSVMSVEIDGTDV